MVTENIVRNRQGIMIGQINDRHFLKDVYGSKHMLHKPMAWAIDADIFDRVIAHNCHTIRITDRETRTRYDVSVKVFRENCQTLDRGHGKQYFLELIYWQARKA